MARGDKHVAIFTAYEDVVPWDPSNPEKNLLRAMLITAMNDIKRKGKIGELARQYFLSSDESYVFSFKSVCAILGVDEKSILRSIGLLDGEGAVVKDLSS